MEAYLTGNQLYAAGDAAGASQAYTLALGHALDDLLTVKVRLNRAQCSLRTEKYSEAVADCTHVINTINNNTSHSAEMLQFRMKSLMRRAQAQEGLGNYQKALLDVEAVLSSDPPAAICKAAVIFRSKLKSFVIADQEVSLSEGRPNMMVTSQQALRLGFIQHPPVTFTLGSSELVRLCITNELGLWDRSLLLHGGGSDAMPRVQCQLRIVSMTQSESEVSAAQSPLTLNLSPACSDNVDMCIGEDGKFDVFLTIALSPSASLVDVDLSQMLVMLEFTLDRPLPTSGEVVPVLSLPARVQPSRTGGEGVTSAHTPIVDDNTKNSAGSTYDRVAHLCDEVHATCVRQINVSLGTSTDPATTAEKHGAESFPVYALESPGYLGIAGKVWDSMYVLLQYLSQQTGSLVRGRRVVELGCGTGLAGISLCTMEPRSVVLTDMPEVVSLISANVLMNSVLVPDPHIRSVLRDRYRAAAYAWGERLVTSKAENGTDSGNAAESQHPYFDLILASDVVYYPEGYTPLITTLCDLLTAQDPEGVDISTEACGGYGPLCILAHRHRHPEDKNFFDALYAARQLQVRKLEFQANHAGQAGSVQALNDVILFEIKRRL